MMVRLFLLQLLLSLFLFGQSTVPVHAEPWKFVSIPDFLNNDVDYPDPRWDGALDYVLKSIQAEDPDFVLVAGDLVMGRWSHSQQHLEQMAGKYYPAWTDRMAAYDLKYYVALGDHEIGDDPWQGDKRALVPHYKDAFRKYLNMPQGGPAGFEQTTYAVRHKNILLVSVDHFEQDDQGNVHVRVGEKQQNWLHKTLADHENADHRVCMGHVPILPGWRWRSSSRFSMPQGAESPLWKLMAQHDVDMYLCGEVHDISLQQRDGVLQVVHGSQPSNVAEFNYLVVEVHPQYMVLTLKSIATVREGPVGKKLDPHGVDPYTQATFRIEESAKRQGFQTVGTMWIDKAATGRRLFDRRTGLCTTRYADQDAPDNIVQHEGEFDGTKLPVQAEPHWDGHGQANEIVQDGHWIVREPREFFRVVRFGTATQWKDDQGEVEIRWASTAKDTKNADGLVILVRDRRLRLFPLVGPDGHDILLTGQHPRMSPDVQGTQLDLSPLSDFRADQLNTYLVRWSGTSVLDQAFEVSVNGRLIARLPGERLPLSVQMSVGLEFRSGEHRVDYIRWKVHGGEDSNIDELPGNVAWQQLIDEGRRQLFLDETTIERREGVTRTLHQPEKYAGNPVIRADQTPWQVFRAQLYGTVLYDPQAKLFRMWYLAGARLPFQEPIRLDGQLRIPNLQLVGYAESDNGFAWELPNLDLVSYNGSRANNICRIARTNVEGIAVIHDLLDPDPSRRFKALYWEHSSSNKDIPDVSVNGMSVSFSTDGKKWTDHPQNPVIDMGSDTGQQALYDPYLEKYVIYGRFGAGGRKVARAESDDFENWSSPARVFQAEAADGARTQVYGMGTSFYEGIYIGLPWMFHEGTSWNIDVQLATSRDGMHWGRVARGSPFIPNGSKEDWDCGIIFTAAQPIQVVGDRIFIFYSASRHNHNYLQRPSKGTPEWSNFWKTVKTSIGVATLRRDGFVSLDAANEAGTVITKPFRWPSGKQLFVNADASSGHMVVQVLDENEQPLEDLGASSTIRGDELGSKVVWPNNKRDTSGTVRLKFTLNHASLYSYWFE